VGAQRNIRRPHRNGDRCGDKENRWVPLAGAETVAQAQEQLKTLHVTGRAMICRFSSARQSLRIMRRNTWPILILSQTQSVPRRFKKSGEPSSFGPRTSADYGWIKSAAFTSTLSLKSGRLKKYQDARSILTSSFCATF
jgi:hypothetical protein